MFFQPEAPISWPLSCAAAPAVGSMNNRCHPAAKDSVLPLTSVGQRHYRARVKLCNQDNLQVLSVRRKRVLKHPALRSGLPMRGAAASMRASGQESTFEKARIYESYMNWIACSESVDRSVGQCRILATGTRS